MKVAILAFAALSTSALLNARAQIIQTAIPNSSWSVSTIAGSNPTCSMVGVVGQGRLSLTVLGAVPGVVHLQLDKHAWSMAPGNQVHTTFHFMGHPNVQLSGIKGGASTLFNLTQADLPASMLLSAVGFGADQHDKSLKASLPWVPSPH